MEKFKCRYEVDDSYDSKSRPKYFNIDESELEDDMTEQDLEALFYDSMRDDFEQSIYYPYEKNQNEFVEWAKGIIEKQKSENEEIEED